MKLIRPLKIVSFVSSVLFAAYYMTVFNAYLCKEWHKYKRTIATQVIAEDLDGKDLTIDIKAKTTKPGSKLTPEEMRKALWVFQAQKEQLQYSLDTVRSALAYHGEDEQ